MSMVTPVTLFAVPTLEKVADLSLVDTLCNTEITITMSERAILIVAPALQE